MESAKPSQGWLAPLAMVAFVAAAAFVDQAAHGHNLQFVAITGALAVIAGALALGRCAPDASLPLGPVALAALAFFAWSVVPTLTSNVPYLSWVELAILGAFTVAFLAWRLETERQAVPPWLLPAFGVAVGLLAAGLMLGQFFIGMRPVGLFMNPNSAAALVNLFWPAAALLAVLAAYHRRWHAYAALLIAFFVMVVAVALDGSRAAFLGACGGLVVVLLSAAFGLGAPTRRLVLLGWIFAGAMLSAHLLSMLDLGFGRDLGSRVASLSEPATASSVRLLQWAAAWELIREQPWLGIGPGTFWLAYAAIRPEADGTYGSYVHNDYLQFWVERGIAAPVLVLVIGLVCAVLFYRALRAGRSGALDPAAVAAIGAAGAGIATAATHGLFSYNLQLGGILLFLALQMADLERLAPGRVWARLPLPNWRRPLVLVSGLAVLALTGLLLALMAASERATERGLAYMQQGAYQEAEEAFSEARRRWSAPDPAWLHHVDVYRHVLHTVPDEETALRRELLREAFDLLDEAQARNPYRPQTHLLRGMLYRDHADLLEGDPVQAFEQALELDPRATQVRTTYAAYLVRQGDEEAAHELLERGLEYRYAEDPEDLWVRAAQMRLRVGDEEGAEALRERLERGG